MFFCTFFDSNYLNKGLSCYNSLMRYDNNLILFILCLDENVYKKVLNLPNVVPINFTNIENYYPIVYQARSNRALKEYYLTMKPLLPLYIFDKHSPDLLFYIDSDMFFWSDPNEIINVMGKNSIMASDHDLTPVCVAGRFNAGFLGYRNDQNCKSFLEWWRDRCMEWCEWRYGGPGKCGDQGYLDILHTGKFNNFLSCPHIGINIGPWKIAKHTITENNGKLIVDGKYNLICYHFHGIDQNGKNGTGWNVSDYNTKLLYSPYHLVRSSL